MVNVVVTGPESSGTRFVSQWLEAHPEVVARHWSMPSGEAWARHWPTDHDFEGAAPDAIVFVVRDFEATIASQIDRDMVTCREEAEANIVQAHLRVLAWAVSHGCPLYPLAYESITADHSRFDALFGWLGVDPVPSPQPVVDATLARLS